MNDRGQRVGRATSRLTDRREGGLGGRGYRSRMLGKGVKGREVRCG